MEAQCVLTVPILEGLDGRMEDGVLTGKKMSKSLGNYVGIQEPPLEMVGKLMSIADELMWRYFDLLSIRKTSDIAALKASVAAGEAHPMAVKKELAAELVGRYHGEAVGREATEEWSRIFSQREVPTDIESHEVSAPEGEEGLNLINALRELKLVASTSEARRLLSQGAISVEGEVIKALDHALSRGGPWLIKVGKRRYARVLVK